MQTLFVIAFTATVTAIFFYVAKHTKHQEIGDRRIYKIPAAIPVVLSGIGVMFIFALFFQILPHATHIILGFCVMSSLIAFAFLGATLTLRLRVILDSDSIRFILIRTRIIKYSAVNKLLWMRGAFLAIHYGEQRSVVKLSKYIGDFDDLVDVLRERCGNAKFEKIY